MSKLIIHTQYIYYDQCCICQYLHHTLFDLVSDLYLYCFRKRVYQSVNLQEVLVLPRLLRHLVVVIEDEIVALGNALETECELSELCADS